MKGKQITRIWHGKTSLERAEEYYDLLIKTGVNDYVKTNGLRSIKILRDVLLNEAHFWLVTEWNNLESIAGFTGTDINSARYYEEDDQYLLEKEKNVLNLETNYLFGELQHIIRDFTGAYNGNNWVGISIKRILEKISPEKALEKKLLNRHTIYEIVEHSFSWRMFLLKRLNGDKDYNIIQNDQKDWPEYQNPEEQNWKNLKALFVECHSELCIALNNEDDRLLERNVEQRNYNFRYLINGIIQHDYYHFGQISLLT